MLYREEKFMNVKDNIKALEEIRYFIRPDTFWGLYNLFVQSNNNVLTEENERKLACDLKQIFQNDSSIFFYESPSGKNFIAIAFDKIMLINIFGIEFIEDSVIMADGEQFIRNIQWMEKDNLVVYDSLYIIGCKSQKCICHFSRDVNSFVYFGELKKIGMQEFEALLHN